ncbi:MAG: amino acid ABC transporter substrate-binding protein [Tetragenococcus halophilus]|uniref:Transporter substrate-binding domain-containing protein n=1 Tax=Tetragenococcus halophilus TaxID=51669 RepID=A0AB37D5Z3_TETHA|nr:amino acid ABC transporter substrate-binding protein [Tetragenococcus halophilus]MCO8288495.1 amino acid ABC transporter substrate-binding protein [Tetragenococcus halophilus]MCO8291817.1 amino acid ABC transporter substrate-binding protein [Tetragenococcus halophilus]MCT8309495.1 amino acid ABC transporter substrate-binding protein [Tetragenococcus halophilus]MDN6127186.1 amino acid ABC transporter substrate-binding protein [Tetragenococcus halophilus]QGP76913.1 transporter substrate-bindi
MKKLKGIVLGLASVFLLGACSSGGNEQADNDTENADVVIGLDDTFVPMGFRDDDGNLTGFDIELAKAVFALNDTEVAFQPIDWSMKENELNNETIDAIWNGYTQTPEREDEVAFSDPYMNNSQLLVTSKDSGINSVEEMDGEILGAQEGSSGYNSFNNDSEVLKDRVDSEDATLYDSFNEAFIDLESGRIDGLLIDRVYAEYYLNQNEKIDDFNLIETPYEDENFAVGVRPDDKELLQEINDGINELQENGEFAEISEKWFGEDVSID